MPNGVNDLPAPVYWLAEAEESDATRLLAGCLPEKKDEIALSDYGAWLLTTGFKYRDEHWSDEVISLGEVTPQTLIGKTLFRLNYVVSGVFSTNFDAGKYVIPKKGSLCGYEAIKRPFDGLDEYAFHSFGGIGLLSKEGMARYLSRVFSYKVPYPGLLPGEKGVITEVHGVEGNTRILKDSDSIFFLNPEETELGEGEYLLDYASLTPLFPHQPFLCRSTLPTPPHPFLVLRQKSLAV